MTGTEIATEVTKFIGSGLAGVLLAFKLGSRKQDTSEFNILVDKYKELLDKTELRLNTIEEEMEILRKENSDQKEEISKLRTQLMIFEGSHLDLPLPMWMKDVNGEMIFLNDHYEEEFLIPRGYSTVDYVGKNDYSVWPDAIAKAFVSHDKETIKRRQSRRYIEILEDSKGEKVFAEVLKYPRMLDNRIIGISGIVLRVSSEKFSIK